MTAQDAAAGADRQQRQVEFYLAPSDAQPPLTTIAGLGLRPALLASYRDLPALRHDFPLVLLRARRDESALRPLGALIDAALVALDGGPDADRLRHHATRLEREIRRRAGAGRTLAETWQEAASALVATTTESELGADLERLRAALGGDGELADCDAAMPALALGHAFEAMQRRKAGRFRTRIERLVRRLSDILAADHVASDAGRSAANLQAAIGPGGSEMFDFEALSRLLRGARPGSPLTVARRDRIAGLLTVLREQPFFAVEASPPERTFSSVAAALEAYRHRLPQAASLLRAIAIAELEVEGLYSEARHDALFARMAESVPEPDQLADFPDLFVCLSAHAMQPGDAALAAEAMAAGLPLKLLLRTDDLLAPSPSGGRPVPMGLAAQSLVQTALSLGEVFVLQVPASHLPAHAIALFAGLDRPGPALFSVFSGATGHAGSLPPYLVAAAALEARVFPIVMHDPAAGDDWAARFSIAANPQPDRPWPAYTLDFEDAGHFHSVETLAFTVADFLACDDRFGADFAVLTRADWSERLLPMAQFLVEPSRDAAEALPTILLVDEQNLLHKAIADASLVRASRQAEGRWRGLQERGGIGNSHVAHALAEARRAGDEAEVAAPTEAVALASDTSVEKVAEAEAPSDDPYIETPRCSSCNECVQLNGKMFAYDKNKQAYVADASAGTFRELVEAAESCQVSVIHPGRPRNPKEPGLEDLLERAMPFL